MDSSAYLLTSSLILSLQSVKILLRCCIVKLEVLVRASVHSSITNDKRGTVRIQLEGLGP